MNVHALQTAWNEALRALTLIPQWLYATIIVAAAIAMALALYGISTVVMRRMLAERRPRTYALLAPLRQPYCLALILFALNVAIFAAPIEAGLKFVLSAVLRLCFAGLIGWMAIVAVNIAADFYLRRFDLEAEDNLVARKQVTQVRVLKGTLNTVIVVITLGVALMSFEAVREIGVSLFASAGIAGIVVGLAARPVLSNLIAGVQLAITQPIRLEDAVVIENEMGFIEEITSTYVVVRIWDGRRLIVPLSYFLEKPIQNWTHKGGGLLGTVMIHADYTVPVERVRGKLKEIVEASPLWDGRVAGLQVTNADAHGVELRALVSARNAAATFDLRCEVREKLIAFIASECPNALPRRRQEALAEPAEKSRSPS